MKVLHTITLSQAVYSIKLSSDSAFSLVGGVATGRNLSINGTVASPGSFLHPHACTNHRYLISGGVPGLPYAAELGPGGEVVQFDFQFPVCALIVAADTFQTPAIAAKVVGFDS